MGNKACVVLLCIALILTNCTPKTTDISYQRDGQIFGTVRGTFRNRWWNYYDRALSFAEGQFYREAVGDLEIALRKRSDDQRMARTYGMHFVDYFPHRELGVILYQQGDLAAARQHLELSLEQFPTDRAAFYLNQVRKTQLEQAGTGGTEPELRLDVPLETRTREPKIVISGRAVDPNLVAELSIGHAPLLFGAARENFTFAREIRLRPGANDIFVQATNLLGGVTRKTFRVELDQNGPLISIEEMATVRQAGRTVTTIRGLAFDEAGIETLVINGHSQVFEKKPEVSFVYQADVPETRLEIRSRDRLDNESVVSLAPEAEKTSRAPVRLAGLDPTSAGRLAVAEALQEAADRQRPTIHFKGWEDDQRVLLDRVFIEGEARDNSGIADLTLNGRPIMRRPGKLIFFNGLVDLEKGANDIVVTAIDDEGNSVSRKIAISREIPAALQLAERMSLTVLPFDLKGEISPLSEAFLDQIMSALFERNRFRIIERDKLDLILQEQKLSATDLVDRRTALRVGKLVAARTALTGSIVESPQGYEIVVRLIDTETSEVLLLTDVYDEGKDLETLRELSAGLALKIHREFPLLEGSVLNLNGDSLFIDLGAGKIKLQRRFIVYREKPLLHPVTGKVLGNDNVILGRARVTQVMDDLSKAELEGGAESAIQPMDRVITE